MTIRTNTPNLLENPPIPVQVKRAAAGTSFMFLWIHVDYLALDKPGFVDEILAAIVHEFDTDPTFGCCSSRSGRHVTGRCCAGSRILEGAVRRRCGPRRRWRDLIVTASPHPFAHRNGMTARDTDLQRSECHLWS